MIAPRLKPLPVDSWDAETRQLADNGALVGDEGGRVLNIFATLARHPKLLKRWLVFGTHVLAKSTLDARTRELVILRTGWLCGAPYEWGQHVVIGRAVGITDDEVTALTVGPTATIWSTADALALQATDELYLYRTVTASTYGALAQIFNEQQLIDLVFTVGQYQLVSTALNTFSVQRDDGVEGVPIPTSANERITNA